MKNTCFPDIICGKDVNYAKKASLRKNVAPNCIFKTQNGENHKKSEHTYREACVSAFCSENKTPGAKSIATPAFYR